VRLPQKLEQDSEKGTVASLPKTTKKEGRLIRTRLIVYFAFHLIRSSLPTLKLHHDNAKQHKPSSVPPTPLCQYKNTVSTFFQISPRLHAKSRNISRWVAILVLRFRSGWTVIQVSSPTLLLETPTDSRTGHDVSYRTYHPLNSLASPISTSESDFCKVELERAALQLLETVT